MEKISPELAMEMARRERQAEDRKPVIELEIKNLVQCMKQQFLSYENFIQKYVEERLDEKFLALLLEKNIRDIAQKEAQTIAARCIRDRIETRLASNTRALNKIISTEVDEKVRELLESILKDLEKKNDETL